MLKIADPIDNGGDGGQVVPPPVHLLRPHLHLGGAAVGVRVVYMVEREAACRKRARHMSDGRCPNGWLTSQAQAGVGRSLLAVLHLQRLQLA